MLKILQPSPLQQALQLKWPSVEGPSILATGTPRTNIARDAADCSGSVVAGLDSRAFALQLASRQGSKAAVASGLRAWQEFAVSILGYPPDATLPPLFFGARAQLRIMSVPSLGGVGCVIFLCNGMGHNCGWRLQG